MPYISSEIFKPEGNLSEMGFESNLSAYSMLKLRLIGELGLYNEF